MKMGCHRKVHWQGYVYIEQLHLLFCWHKTNCSLNRGANYFAQRQNGRFQLNFSESLAVLWRHKTTTVVVNSLVVTDVETTKRRQKLVEIEGVAFANGFRLMKLDRQYDTVCFLNISASGVKQWFRSNYELLWRHSGTFRALWWSYQQKGLGLHYTCIIDEWRIQEELGKRPPLGPISFIFIDAVFR